MHIYADTEDNSPELLAANKSGMAKYVTQIAAIADNGKQFYAAAKSKDEAEKIVKKFLVWLQHFQDDPVCWFHNLQYDLGNLFGDTLDSINVTLVGSRMISASYHNITFMNSFNIWPMKLAKIGERFGLEKGKLDVNSKHYVYTDVRILRRAIKFTLDFCKEYDIDISATLGGLCVKVWKSIGGSNWQETNQFIQEGLFGGRVELFHQGGSGCFYYTDINSLYPYCMTKPFAESCEPRDCSKNFKGFGVARVTIDVPKMFVSPLPCRNEMGGIMYATGKLTGVWTWHEIVNAQSLGAKVLKVHESWGCDKGVCYYKNFVQQMYKLRLEADDVPRKEMYKLLMNNLYGQLGCSGNVTRSVLLTEEDFDEDDSYDGDGVPYGRKHLLAVKTPLQQHVNYLHAAYVTGYGRLELFKYLQMLQEKLVYCDTDSVIFHHNEKDKLPFECGTELGQMKLVGIANQVHTYAPKMYECHGDKMKIIKAKGVRADKAEEFIRKGKVVVEQPYKFREAVEFYDRGNVKKLSVWRKLEKVMRSKYDKKKQDKEGRWFPLHFDDFVSTDKLEINPT